MSMDSTNRSLRPDRDPIVGPLFPCPMDKEAGVRQHGRGQDRLPLANAMALLVLCSQGLVHAQDSAALDEEYSFSSNPEQVAELQLLLKSGKLTGYERLIGKIGDGAIPIVLQALLAHDVTERAERRQVIQGLRLVRKSALTQALEAWLTPLHGLEFRFTVLEVLAEIGAGKDLSLAFRAATPPRPEFNVDPGLCVALSETISGILVRDRNGFKIVMASYPDVRVELQIPIINGVSTAGGDGALEVLAGILSKDSDASTLIVTHIGRVADRMVGPPKAWIAEGVARGLDAVDLGLRRETILTLGRIEDPACVPKLVALLNAEEESLKSAAGWSLRRITALAFPSDARTWNSWLELEQQWWSGEASHALFCLHSDDEAVVARAIEDISAHRLNRHELARELSLSLTHMGPGVQRAQIQALRGLSSELGIARLLEGLDSSEESVQVAAWRGLKEITRKDLPRDVASWQAALR